MTIADLRAETRWPVVLVDRGGTIIHVNDRFSAAFGWSRDEILGAPLTTLIPVSMQDAHNLGFSRYLATSAPTILDRPLMLKIRFRDGAERPAEHTIVAGSENGATVFGAVIRPAAATSDGDGTGAQP